MEKRLAALATAAASNSRSEQNKKWFRDICVHALPRLRALPLPAIPSSAPNEIVFVEHRSGMPHLEALIRNAAILLGDSWCITVVGGKHTNAAFLTELCRAIHPRIRVVLVDTVIESKQQYKKWIRTRDFWCGCLQPSTRTVLLCTEDSLLLKPISVSFLSFSSASASMTKPLGDDGFCLCTTAREPTQIIRFLHSITIPSHPITSTSAPTSRTISSIPFLSHSRFDASAVGMHSWWRGCNNKMWTFTVEGHWTQLSLLCSGSGIANVSLPYAYAPQKS